MRTSATHLPEWTPCDMIKKRDDFQRLQRAIEIGTCVQRHMEYLEEKERRSVKQAVRFEKEDHRDDGDVTKGWHF